MSFNVKVIEYSVNDYGNKLVTFQLRYPRFIHPEFMTHREFTRNASSSRAVPVETTIKRILADTAMPVHWGKNQPGMQAREELDDRTKEFAQDIWMIARDNAIRHATMLHKIGAHKQIVNRILEPFSHIEVVMSTTNMANWNALRRHEDAQPEIKVLADLMFDELAKRTPTLLKPGEWHTPYVSFEERAAFTPKICAKLSVARCARVSYLTHDGEHPVYEKDMALYDRLVGSVPLHASPAEHQATPDVRYDCLSPAEWDYPEQHGNFTGWRQHRKMLPNEYVSG